MVKLGSRGTEVRQIQTRLSCMVTGVFDTPTCRAVSNFQIKNNKKATGMVDEETYDLLFPRSTVQDVVEEVVEIVKDEIIQEEVVVQVIKKK
jgi:peptidoglycan hydrolase-like protein with peptidoglycan-binding domain